MKPALNSVKNLVRAKPLYVAVVVAPFLLMAFYWGLWASDAFVSRAQLIVEHDSQMPTTALDLGLLGLGSSTSKADALLIKEFISSRAMLDHLQKTLDLRSHYRGDGVDWLSSLPEGASDEEFYEYYHDHLTVTVDSESTTISLQVDAYEREFAQKVAQAIVKRSEDFVNDISRQMAREELAYVQSEVDGAAKRMHDASNELIALQRQYKVMSPEAESQTSAGIVAGLQQSLAQSRTELKTLLGYLNETAPEVITVRKRLNALEGQIEQERRRQVGGVEPGVNDLMLRYQSAQLNVQLTSDLYQAALKALEVTRLDSSRKAKYLVQVSPANLPDEAELPATSRILVAAFIFLNLGYFLVSLLVAVVRDHRD